MPFNRKHVFVYFVTLFLGAACSDPQPTQAPQPSASDAAERALTQVNCKFVQSYSYLELSCEGVSEQELQAAISGLRTETAKDLVALSLAMLTLERQRDALKAYAQATSGEYGDAYKKRELSQKVATKTEEHILTLRTELEETRLFALEKIKENSQAYDKLLNLHQEIIAVEKDLDSQGVTLLGQNDKPEFGFRFGPQIDDNGIERIRPIMATYEDLLVKFNKQVEENSIPVAHVLTAQKPGVSAEEDATIKMAQDYDSWSVSAENLGPVTEIVHERELRITYARVFAWTFTASADAYFRYFVIQSELRKIGLWPTFINYQGTQEGYLYPVGLNSLSAEDLEQAQFLVKKLLESCKVLKADSKIPAGLSFAEEITPTRLTPVIAFFEELDKNADYSSADKLLGSLAKSAFVTRLMGRTNSPELLTRAAESFFSPRRADAKQAKPNQEDRLKLIVLAYHWIDAGFDKEVGKTKEEILRLYMEASEGSAAVVSTTEAVVKQRSATLFNLKLSPDQQDFVNEMRTGVLNNLDQERN